MDKQTMTIVFLINGEEVCLAEKKRRFRKGKINGSGGKLEPGESALECAVRETREEFEVDLKEVREHGKVVYIGDSYHYTCHVFVATEWEGEPVETEEMAPDWYHLDNLPLHRMGSTDHLWLPHVLRGAKVKAHFEWDSEKNLVKEEYALE